MQTRNRFKGVFTALATPFKKGEVDFHSLEKLISLQLQSGIQGFVVNGTTAESPTLTKEEVKKIFTFVKQRVPKPFPLIVGTGGNSTAKTIEDSQEAERWGAEALLVVVPYYNKPPQRGLVKHFEAIASSVQIPSLLYNVPTRTITSLELETVYQLSQHPRIIGIKEASGKIEFAQKIRERCGPDFVLLSGDDGTYDEFMEAGGDGVISVASHIIPQAMLNRNAGKNRELIEALFIEANPIPLKMALYLMKVIESPECRLPLVSLAEPFQEVLQKQMRKGGILS